MTAARLEVFVEPFRENDPGPHVIATIDVARDAGLDVEMGPFATTVDGDLDAVVGAAGDMLRAGFGAGATSIRISVDRLDGGDVQR